MFIKKDTAYTTRIGPFLDKTDGVTEETGLTTAAAAIFLSKNGGDYAAKNEASANVHDQDGWYIIIFDATDTNTVGELIVMIQAPATHLPVWKTYYVVEEDTYTYLFAAGSAPDTQQAAKATTADLLDKVGAVDEATAAGDPSATESVMQYVKQIVNVLVGATGVTTFPSEAAPANNVSLAEVVRAIHADVTGLTFTVAGNVDSNLQTINGSTEGVAGLGKSAGTIVTGAAEAGTLSTTQMTTDLTEATDEHFNGRICIWTSGVLQNQASDITAYLGSTGRLTYTATTEAPSAGDTFVIV